VSKTPKGNQSSGQAPVSTAEVTKRQRILDQLDQLDAAVVGWEEYEADRALPLEMKRYPPPPGIPREMLSERHAALVAELGRVVEPER
jgi:hypothetical protein